MSEAAIKKFLIEMMQGVNPMPQLPRPWSEDDIDIVSTKNRVEIALKPSGQGPYLEWRDDLTRAVAETMTLTVMPVSRLSRRLEFIGGKDNIEYCPAEKRIIFHGNPDKLAQQLTDGGTRTGDALSWNLTLALHPLMREHYYNEPQREQGTTKMERLGARIGGDFYAMYLLAQSKASGLSVLPENFASHGIAIKDFSSSHDDLGYHQPYCMITLNLGEAINGDMAHRLHEVTARALNEVIGSANPLSRLPQPVATVHPATGNPEKWEICCRVSGDQLVRDLAPGFVKSLITKSLPDVFEREFAREFGIASPRGDHIARV